MTAGAPLARVDGAITQRHRRRPYRRAPCDDLAVNETWRALVREAALGAEHIAFGATVLGRANYAQHAYYAQAFFSLSVGFERTCKLGLLVDYAIDNGGRFPAERAMRSYGHDLATLLSSVEAIGIRRDLDAELPATQIHKDIISTLSNFATNVTRYYNVNVLVGSSTVGPSDDPIAAWYRKVTEPIIAARYTARRRDRDTANAHIMETLAGPFSMVRHESETGERIDSLYAGANATSVTKVAKPWERMHVLQIARFVGNIVSDLGRVAQSKGVSDIPDLSEFFAIFGNDDSYFRSRKVWSIYRP